MKRYLGFCTGCLLGAVVMSLASWSSLIGLRNDDELSDAQSANRMLQDRYVARVLDFAHLALMLRAVEPQLESEWIQSELSVQTEELNHEFRRSRIVGHAMKMITGYYTKNNLPVPTHIERVCQSLADDPDVARTHSEWTTNAAFDERLLEFDAMVSARRAAEDLRINNPSAQTNPVSWPVCPGESLNNRSAVSF